MKNSSDIIGNRKRDIPACIAVPNRLRHRVIVPTYVQLVRCFRRATKKKKVSRLRNKARPATETAVIIPEGIVAKRLSLVLSAEVKF